VRYRTAHVLVEDRTGSSDFVLGHLQLLAVLQGRLVGDDAANGHIQRLAAGSCAAGRKTVYFEARSEDPQAAGTSCREMESLVEKS